MAKLLPSFLNGSTRLHEKGSIRRKATYQGRRVGGSRAIHPLKVVGLRLSAPGPRQEARTGGSTASSLIDGEQRGRVAVSWCFSRALINIEMEGPVRRRKREGQNIVRLPRSAIIHEALSSSGALNHVLDVDSSCRGPSHYRPQ